ncbi:MAG: ABC transporter ATP-binding protein [Actinobacteria bacterium]|nr:ABC transporter ATP-binding protein [Actinomycetota bacterium]
MIEQIVELEKKEEKKDGPGAVPEIEVKGLSKYFGKRKVLDNISFELKKGGFLSLFGPNGAGKTTLVKIIATLIAPSDGSISVSGLDPAKDSAAIRSKIGLISHNPLLYLDLSAEENLKFYGTMYDVECLDQRIDELLERVELDHRRYDLVRTFSKGMTQRLAIARALLHKPSVLFLDEPHSGLDPHAVDIFEGLLDSIKEDHTFIMITHNIERGIALCSKAMILYNGQIVFYQDKDELDIKMFKSVYRQRVKGDY